MATTTVTDLSFEQDVLCRGAGPRRFLGGMVRSVPDDRAGARGAWKFDELGDRVTIVKPNIDENPAAPTNHGVRGILTMISFKNGQPAATKVGAEPKGASRLARGRLRPPPTFAGGCPREPACPAGTASCRGRSSAVSNG